MKQILLLAAMMFAGTALQAKAPAGWGEDFTIATQQAKTNYKPILLLFDRSGSAFEKDVLATSAFARIRSKVQPVYIEFGGGDLKDQTVNANRALVAKYKVTRTPYMVLLAADGETTIAPVPLQGKPDEIADRVQQMLKNYDTRMAAQIRQKLDDDSRTSFWLTDFDLARARAAGEKKPLLVLFTGSDWCGYCIKMDADLLSKGKFQEFAKQDLIAVYLDFPQKKQLSAEVRAANAEVSQRFKVRGFPTIVMLAPDGTTEVARFEGYNGNPDEWFKQIREAAKKARGVKTDRRR